MMDMWRIFLHCVFQMDCLVFTWYLLLVIISQDLKVSGNTDKEVLEEKMSIDPFTQHKLPVLKMLKRQIRNFRTDQRNNATVTLVFHSKQTVDIHWFSLENIDGEIMKYPIFKDHPFYDVQILTSGEVTATTLVIPHTQHDKTHTLETVLTATEPFMQYQIQTILDTWTIYRLDNIDSPEWLVVPQPKDHLNKGDFFERHCRSFVRKQKGGNALIMMHAPSVLNDAKTRPDFTILVQTHDDGMESFGQESGGMVLKGTLTTINDFKAVCDLRATQIKAQTEREGLYLCIVERQTEGNLLLDRLSILSFLTFGSHHSLSSLIPYKARVEILTCATTNNEITDNQLHLREGRFGCIRCRGFGYPLPFVEILKKQGFGKSQTLSPISSRDATISMFTNVGEGALVEAIYMFKNPDRALQGTYMCTARTENGGNSIFFDIKIENL